jgi:hypothetical protein
MNERTDITQTATIKNFSLLVSVLGRPTTGTVVTAGLGNSAGRRGGGFREVGVLPTRAPAFLVGAFVFFLVGAFVFFLVGGFVFFLVGGSVLFLVGGSVLFLAIGCPPIQPSGASRETARPSGGSATIAYVRRYTGMVKAVEANSKLTPFVLTNRPIPGRAT